MVYNFFDKKYAITFTHIGKWIKSENQQLGESHKTNY